MTSEKRPDSLAEQAAAWVPPWERPAGSASPEPPVEPHAEPAAEPPVDPRRESTAPSVEDLESSPAAERPQVPAGAVTAEPSTAEPGLAEPGLAEPGLAEPSTGEPEIAEPSTGEPEIAEPSTAGGSRIGDGAVVEQAGPVTGAGERGAEPDEAVGVLEDAGAEADGAPAAAPVPGRAGRPTGTLTLIDEDELRGALEAILLVVDEPVTEILLAQVLEQPTERVAAMLDRLSADYTAAGHGFELRRAAGGWRLYTRPEYAAYVERFVLDGQSVRLTQAALETLAVVAYKQPVTRSRISAIRGVNCDGVIRTLVTRGLVEECGTEPESGAFLYRTTTLFLEKLGLDTVAQLPPLAPFLPDDVEEIADAPR
ncbi:SMC-Scp complex subunit ScpB [Plantactinospora veratri]|uniref:SMC-Scp complex subunit ScpB n=1 Tax=Plantactinospora veratri TaxID=1436122 RepID=A0ABU7S8Z0_9ACTN